MSEDAATNPPLPGRATPDGTRRYFEEARLRGVAIQDDAIRDLGRAGLAVGKVGYGTYRVHSDVEEHVRTLLHAMLHGANLVDTSTNYTDGSSERLVGNVLRALTEAGGVSRDGVTIVSKVGYVQGTNYANAVAAEERGEPYAEMVKYRDGLWHCIHPDWVREQLAQSLERTQLETIDVYLLHNPEYFLIDADAAAEGQDADDGAHDEFYRRVTAAFEELERAVVAGRLSYYGVSSNTFPAPTDNPAWVSLPRVLACAEEAAATVHGNAAAHRFAVAQLPLNLYEAGAFTEDHGARDQSFLDFARANDIAVLANRPLNAVVGSRLVRLAQYSHDEDLGDPLEAFADVAAAERDVVLALRSWDVWAPLRDAVSGASVVFNVGESLKGAFPEITGRDQWLQVFEQVVAPSVVACTRAAGKLVPGANLPEWEGLLDVYQRRLHTLASTVTSHFNAGETEAKAPLWRELVSEIAARSSEMTLSQIALNSVASLPGVTAALCGMKRGPYVAEAVELMNLPLFDDAYAAFRAATRVSLDS
jgi:uncharacterized protein